MSSRLKDAEWSEKYRPQAIDGLVLPSKHMKVFKRFVKEGVFPNLLFHGSVGSGKTTAALILAGLGAVKLELNSSDDRTIVPIRTRVKEFVYHSSDGLRVVLLDECDGMLKDAQRALRRLMEKGVGNARFILTANSLNRVIPAIKSRCTLFEFIPPPKKYVSGYMANILKEEKVKFDVGDIDKIISDCYPDIRRCVRTLQLNCHAGRLSYEFLQQGGASHTSDLLDEVINEILEDVPDIKVIWELIVMGKPNFDVAYRELAIKIMKIPEFAGYLQDALLIVGEYAYRDSAIPDRELNFTACCCDLCGIWSAEEEEG